MQNYSIEILIPIFDWELRVSKWEKNCMYSFVTSYTNRERIKQHSETWNYPSYTRARSLGQTSLKRSMDYEVREILEGSQEAALIARQIRRRTSGNFAARLNFPRYLSTLANWNQKLAVDRSSERNTRGHTTMHLLYVYTRTQRTRGPAY